MSSCNHKQCETASYKQKLFIESVLASLAKGDTAGADNIVYNVPVDKDSLAVAIINLPEDHRAGALAWLASTFPHITGETSMEIARQDSVAALHALAPMMDGHDKLLILSGAVYLGHDDLAREALAYVPAVPVTQSINSVSRLVVRGKTEETPAHFWDEIIGQRVVPCRHLDGVPTHVAVPHNMAKYLEQHLGTQEK